MNFRNDKYEYWLSQHRARLTSGESVSDFCRRRGIGSSSYHSAVRRYGFGEDLASRKPSGSFIELTDNDSVRTCILEIEYRGFQIRIYPGLKPAILRETLAVLGEVG